MIGRFRICVFVALQWVLQCVLQGDYCSNCKAETIDFVRDVQPILTKYCTGCHNATENESNVRLHDYDAIMKGGPDGPIVVPGNSQRSIITQLLTGKRDPQMPPADAKQPSHEEISVLLKWIDQGAVGEVSPVPLRQRVAQLPAGKRTPSVFQITSLAWVNDRPFMGMYDGLLVRTNQWNERLPIDVVGKVTQIRTTKDGRWTVVVAGIPGLGGQATVVENLSDLKQYKVRRVIEGHRDTLYSGVLSPNGRILATAGYDRVIMLWDVEDGKLLRTLEGHNGSIYDLDFDDSGEILASASADETIKIWRVSSGERLDTLGQCEAEQYSVRFDSTRERVLAAGADKRIRAWRIQSREKPSVSPMLYATFAHEGPITYMELSRNAKWIVTAGEDKQIKLWDADNLTPMGQLQATPDVPSGLAWSSDSNRILVSTLNGNVNQVDLSNQRVLTSKELSNASRHGSPFQRDPKIEEWDAGEATIATLRESESRRNPSNAMDLPTNCIVHGVLTEGDMLGEHPGDWYAFHAKANQPWVIEINASRSGAPMDSLLDVLDEKGTPIIRTKLQALRESYFTFRGKDSSIADDFRLHRWEDMELNELLYAGGEVVKLWLYPRGPDSGFKVYPGFGKRQTYFDTTATTHALNEPVWIVRELAEDEPAVPNGLPVFPIYYSNDDDSNRIYGTDSKLTFIAKADGKYLVRVRDSRGASGEKLRYQLSIQRPNPRLDFRLEQKEISLRPGVGTEFSVVVDRFDGCDGEIEVKLEGAPEGLQIRKPFSIQAGQHRAIGIVHAPDDLSRIQEFKLKVSCSARVGSKQIDSEAKELAVKVNTKPAMLLKVVRTDQTSADPPLQEITIRPGDTVSVLLVIERGDNKSDIAFGGDDSGRNLPHGCYVDNIGLSGLLIPAGQSVREVFITAARWVPNQTRYFHLRANVDGNPTTLPILIRVESTSSSQSESE